jgi:hypothetical protein
MNASRIRYWQIGVTLLDKQHGLGTTQNNSFGYTLSAQNFGELRGFACGGVIAGQGS